VRSPPAEKLSARPLEPLVLHDPLVSCVHSCSLKLFAENANCPKNTGFHRARGDPEYVSNLPIRPLLNQRHGHRNLELRGQSGQRALNKFALFAPQRWIGARLPALRQVIRQWLLPRLAPQVSQGQIGGNPVGPSAKITARVKTPPRA